MNQRYDNKEYRVFNSLPASEIFCHLIKFVNSLYADQAGLIWIQTIWHSDGILERIFWMSSF